MSVNKNQDIMAAVHSLDEYMNRAVNDSKALGLPHAEYSRVLAGLALAATFSGVIAHAVILLRAAQDVAPSLNHQGTEILLRKALLTAAEAYK